VTDHPVVIPDSERLECEADLFGVRPLYYAQCVGSHAVCATLSGLREVGVDVSLSRERVRDHLLGDCSQSLAGWVQRVDPGAELVIENGEAFTTRAPELAAEDLAVHTRKQLAGTLLDRLGDAIDNLTDGRKMAVSLSGGLDSAALLALADGKVSTWTLVSGPADDAFLTTRRLAQEFGAEQHLVEVRDAKLPDAFEDAVRASESLLWNPRAVARMLFHKAVEDPVLLSGSGADELLMGYPHALRGDAENGPPVTRRFDADTRLLTKLLAEDLVPEPPEPTVGMTMEQARDYSVSTVLPYFTLPAEYHAIDAAGPEVLHPFLAPDVASFAMALSSNDLIEDALGKRPLREALDGLVPDPVRLAQKQVRLCPPGGGRAELKQRWADLYDGLLSEERVATLPAVDGGKVRRLIAAYAREERLQHPGFVVMDRVLMRLASLSVLHEALG